MINIFDILKEILISEKEFNYEIRKRAFIYVQ